MSRHQATRVATSKSRPQINVVTSTSEQSCNTRNNNSRVATSKQSHDINIQSRDITSRVVTPKQGCKRKDTNFKVTTSGATSKQYHDIDIQSRDIVQIAKIQSRNTKDQCRDTIVMTSDMIRAAILGFSKSMFSTSFLGPND